MNTSSPDPSPEVGLTFLPGAIWQYLELTREVPTLRISTPCLVWAILIQYWNFSCFHSELWYVHGKSRTPAYVMLWSHNTKTLPWLVHFRPLWNQHYLASHNDLVSTMWQCTYGLKLISLIITVWIPMYLIFKHWKSHWNTLCIGWVSEVQVKSWGVFISAGVFIRRNTVCWQRLANGKYPMKPNQPSIKVMLSSTLPHPELNTCTCNQFRSDI